MKNKILIFIGLILTQWVMAQSPGGVTGANGWFKGELAGSSSWSNAIPSSSIGSLTTVVGVPNTTSTKLNFNKVVTYAGSSHQSVANLGDEAVKGVSVDYSYMVVLRSTADNQSVMGVTSFNYGLGSGFARVGNTTAVNYTNQTGRTQFDIVSVFKETNGAYTFYANGLPNGSGTQTANPNSTTSSFGIGFGTNVSVAEALVYPISVSAHRDRLESYLGIKYGITKTGNYLNSNGDIVYNNATYTQNIAAIGRDDNSALHQRQSVSQNSGIQPIIGNNNTILATNTTGAGDLTTNNSFMFWGSDSNSDNYIVFNSGNVINKRIEKIWSVQEVGTVWSVKVAVKKSDLKGTLPTLLISSNNTFDSGDTMLSMVEETIDGVVYYTVNVDLASGQFFTFGTLVPDPGNVLGARLWLKADAGTSTTANGTTVSSWADQSLQIDNNFIQATATSQPTYSTNVDDMINGLPVLRFDGGDVLNDANGIFTLAARTNAVMYVVAKNNALTCSTFFNQAIQQYFWCDGNTYWDAPGGGSRITGAGANTLGNPILWTFYNVDGPTASRSMYCFK